MAGATPPGFDSLPDLHSRGPQTAAEPTTITAAHAAAALAAAFTTAALAAAAFAAATLAAVAVAAATITATRTATARGSASGWLLLGLQVQHRGASHRSGCPRLWHWI